MLQTIPTAVPIATGGILALLGLFVLANGVRTYWHQSRAIRRSEQASGTIESVSVEPVLDGGSSTTYVPTVDYEYQTPTQRLRGTTVYPGESRVTKLFHSESAAETVIQEYEPGGSAIVYYDPANPDHSFLEPEVQRGPNLSKILLGIGLIGLGVFIIAQIGLVYA